MCQASAIRLGPRNGLISTTIRGLLRKLDRPRRSSGPGRAISLRDLPSSFVRQTLADAVTRVDENFGLEDADGWSSITTPKMQQHGRRCCDHSHQNLRICCLCRGPDPDCGVRAWQSVPNPKYSLSSDGPCRSRGSSACPHPSGMMRGRTFGKRRKAIGLLSRSALISVTLRSLSQSSISARVKWRFASFRPKSRSNTMRDRVKRYPRLLTIDAFEDHGIVANMLARERLVSHTCARPTDPFHRAFRARRNCDGYASCR